VHTKLGTHQFRGSLNRIFVVAPLDKYNLLRW
jgi:hypothetical protein